MTEPRYVGPVHRLYVVVMSHLNEFASPRRRQSSLRSTAIATLAMMVMVVVVVRLWDDSCSPFDDSCTGLEEKGSEYHECCFIYG